jgi:glycine cleavage system aminomethyltransferase T/glycine/D-amino acid oxidase-like deaminating enzyme
MANPRDLPRHAQAVIVGGGVIGTSIAYHLAKLGWKDVVLLERHQLTAGTTWHAAGLMVTYGSTSETSTELRKYTRDLYARLEAETGQATGFMPIGFIEVAADADRLEEFRRVAAFNRYCGVDVQELSPREVGELFPLARVDDIEAGFYVAEDGRVNPVDVTMALAKGARMGGVMIFEAVPATRVLHKQGRVTGVATPLGEIQTDIVVNCAGLWARELAAQNGVALSNQAAEHYYLITEPIKDLPPNMPVLEDPSAYGYYRQEGAGLMVGLFEPKCAPWMVDRAPVDMPFADLEPDWERMGPYLETAMARVPITAQVGMKKFFCGPESFTPDLLPLVGEAPNLRGYFVAAGLNSIGILTGGGLGRVMAHWIVHGLPDVDVTAMNVDRVLPYQANRDYRRARTVESLGMVYKCHYPYKSLETARGARRSAFHDRLAAQGAYFVETSGWESPGWYAGAGVTPEPGPLWWQRQLWWPHWQREHRAAREGVVVMDMSFMGKFEVQGRDAGKCLNWISANDVDGAAGQITYTQWLNARGRLEADLTVTKLDDDRFFVVVTDTMVRHAESWMKRNIPDGAHAFVTDVSSGVAQLNVQGPRSRELLQSLTSVDLSNEAFPFRMAREIDIGYARVLCVRITYVGELGYELYIPTEQAVHVYDQVVEAGARVGLVHAGLRALGSLRMEKGYRDYGHDLDNTDDPYETGLGFAVDLKKPDGFLGKDALLERRARGPLRRRLVQVLLQDPEPLMYHAEVVHRDGVAVGYVRAASYGHTLGGAIGLAMIEPKGVDAVDAQYLASGRWDVEIAGRRHPATVSLKPLYDPGNERIRR